MSAKIINEEEFNAFSQKLFSELSQAKQEIDLLKQNQSLCKVLTHLSLEDLQSMSKILDYDKLVQSYLDHGFTWNADQTVLSGYEREI